jgi:alpha-ketoglutarate-dependent taurine dioxygenase
MRVEIEPIKPLIGAIVHVERSALFDDAVVQRCLEALEDRGVIVFPRLGLSDDEQLAFTDSLGTRVKFTRGASDVYEVTLDPDVNDEPEYVQGTYFWHIDGVTIDMPPPKATLLSARRISSRGGQTEFSNTYAA